MNEASIRKLASSYVDILYEKRTAELTFVLENADFAEVKVFRKKKLIKAGKLHDSNLRRRPSS